MKRLLLTLWFLSCIVASCAAADALRWQPGRPAFWAPGVDAWIGVAIAP